MSQMAFLSVSNVRYFDNLQVEGLMRLMEGEHVGPFNLGNPGEFTMLELAKVRMHATHVYIH